MRDWQPPARPDKGPAASPAESVARPTATLRSRPGGPPSAPDSHGAVRGRGKPDPPAGEGIAPPAPQPLNNQPKRKAGAAMPEPILLYLEILLRLWWVPAVICLAWLLVRLEERRTR